MIFICRRFESIIYICFDWFIFICVWLQQRIVLVLDTLQTQNLRFYYIPILFLGHISICSLQPGTKMRSSGCCLFPKLCPELSERPFLDLPRISWLPYPLLWFDPSESLPSGSTVSWHSVNFVCINQCILHNVTEWDLPHTAGRAFVAACYRSADAVCARAVAHVTCIM